MISIVIPAYNEEKTIAQCLESLVAQKTAEKLEVIVVDNGSRDRTVSIAKKFEKKLPLRIINEMRKGRGAARFAGFLAAKGELIFSTDADCRLNPYWIEHMSKIFKNKDVVGVTGTCHMEKAPWLTRFIFNYGFQTGTQLFYWIFHRHWCLVGFNFALKKEAYVKSGGFNPDLNCREDADLSEKIAPYGRIVLTKISVFYSGRRYQKGFLKGLAPYIKNLILSSMIGKQTLSLEDIR